MEFNANVTEITENSVIYEKNGKVTEIPNDHVFAMIGYHPDYDFLESIGIEINTNEYGTAPVHNKETLRQMLRIAILGVIAQVMIIMQSLLKMVNIMAELLLKVF